MFSRVLGTAFVIGCAIATTNCSHFAVGQTALPNPDQPLNHYQFIGTHNSYHLAPSEKLRQLINNFAAGQGEALNYTHRPLRYQLENLGIRQIELDIYGDPQGGLYAHPLANQLTGQGTPTDPAWQQPGFKIFHSPDFDQNTTVVSLREALRQLRSWSKDFPDHEPVFVLLELETESFSATKPPVFDAAALTALEKEIEEEIPSGDLVTPDFVRGRYATLREAIEDQGWPKLSALRGKFIFALDNEDASRDRYLALSEKSDLRGRTCFVSVPRDHPAAAWMKRNDPIGSYDEIQSLVKAGFMVRTRADADMNEVLANDHKRLKAALSSGAQWISTDAPEPIAAQPDYSVAFPHRAPYRLNPLFR